ncbi:MAG: DUF1501 domain-containing protein [Pseudomonadota bacterium]
MITRRTLIASSLAAVGTAVLPRISFAKGGSDERRFIFIIQRGAADGLYSVAPVGDPGLRAARVSLVDGMGEGVKLDSLFALHPALKHTAGFYRGGEALFVHAVASANRDRSHFDAQNILETGGLRAYAEQYGWMNRLVGILPGADPRAMALAQTLPAALRGPNSVSSYAPSRLPDALQDLMSRVTDLYAHDLQLRGLWQSAMDTRALAGNLGEGEGRSGAATGALAAKLMLPANGARLLMIETGGWDTHSAQKGRLNAGLNGLDQMIGAIKAGLGAAWANTMILVATEFGRTVAVNGTGGTDHGTASATMLIGGAVKGGRVIADWPGLRSSDQFEGRDLKPTIALEAVIAGAIAGHFALDPVQVAKTLYPSLPPVKRIEGLIHT